MTDPQRADAVSPERHPYTPVKEDGRPGCSWWPMGQLRCGQRESDPVHAATRPLRRPPMAKQTPKLMIGGLTKTIYAVTRYTELDGNLTEAREKHDVTRDFLSVAAQIDKPAADILADALGFEITTKALHAQREGRRDIGWRGTHTEEG